MILTVVVGLVAGIVGGIIGTQLSLVAFVRGMQSIREREKRDATGKSERLPASHTCKHGKVGYCADCHAEFYP